MPPSPAPSAPLLLTPTHLTVLPPLSTLLLDTTLTPASSLALSQTLHALHLPLPTLIRLLREEVFPACHHNLYDPAGEWVAFDGTWLVRRVKLRRWVLSWRVGRLWLRGREERVRRRWSEVGEGLVRELVGVWELGEEGRDGIMEGG
ncbi:hypothetical protein EX30DRAFT_343847 [Ascodesmis nigricans]|uniref:DUF7079 domain-containing protein n=1 Tax=Ascodesmis nigricans TaxID=341454 RepID=A0A4S2MRK0_9PEZI|nr:hypothetical protein EX30DRAFT_343847 [Ascodesmis nigricans]